MFTLIRHDNGQDTTIAAYATIADLRASFCDQFRQTPRLIRVYEDDQERVWHVCADSTDPVDYYLIKRFPTVEDAADRFANLPLVHQQQFLAKAGLEIVS